MKCVLMNKNTEILIAEYDTELKIFNEIIEIKNIDYAPVSLQNSYEKVKTLGMIYLNGSKVEEYHLGEMI